MKRIILFGILFMVSVVLNCAALGSVFEHTELKPVKAKVTLNIFSGRPNPTWSLSAKNVVNLTAIVNDLPKSDSISFPEELGYNGFQVELTKSEVDKSIITVYKGLVLYKVNGTNHYFTDSQRLVEKFLLESGKSTLNPQLYRTVQTELEAGGN